MLHLKEREKRSRPLKLILQQQREGGGGGGGAAGQPGPYCAFGTDPCRVGPQRRDGASLVQGWELQVVSVVLLCMGAPALLLEIG